MKKLSLIFPGQGSQYVGMGKRLYENSGTARQVFEEVSDSLNMDMAKLCFDSGSSELMLTENTQPALLTVSVSMFRVYMEQGGAEPSYLAGHSLGEISALVCTNAIKLGDAAKIVRQRGRFMQETVTLGEGVMAAISGIDVESIEKQCNILQSIGRVVVISNYNSPSQTVISGTADGVEEVCRELEKLGAKAVVLNVSAPFHSPLMKPAAKKFKAELEKYEYQPLRWPVISNVTGLPYANENTIISNLCEQIYKPVQWVYTMDYLKSSGVDTLVELGPKDVLKNLSVKIAPTIKALSYDKPEDEDVIANLTSRNQIVKQSRIKLLTRCLAIAVCTPNNNWDNEEYLQGVVEPYKKIEKCVEELEKSNEEPSEEQMTEAVVMLQSVFRTKRTPLEEQRERFQQLIDELGMEQFILKTVSESEVSSSLIRN
ncbi:ACP S-malonyltransferase [Paenibacillus glucanolyticus]|uniref:ACP S-malonyltransferase n=1 Tax=Paenibacillus glucanolyticus TaxID=59843 RepID=UPI0036BCDF38